MRLTASRAHPTYFSLGFGGYFPDSKEVGAWR